MTERSANRDHLRAVDELVDLEIDVLTRQARLQEEEMSVQDDQLRSARELVEKGLMPLSRLQEQEREASRLSRDLLETQAFAARARQNKQSNLYEIGAAEIERRMDLRADLRAALLDLGDLETQRDVISAALVSAGILLIDGGAAPEPQIVINRTTSAGAAAFAAGMDTPILPGDVLEVSLATAPQG